MYLWMKCTCRLALAYAMTFASIGCAPPGANPAAPEGVPASEEAPLNDQAASEGTTILVGSDRYYVRASRAEAPKTAAPEPIKATEPELTQTIEPKHKTKPGARVKPKPKSAPKAVDIEFVLSKSKDISVGMASDAPEGRMQNDDVSFVPASITKVLTAAAALRGLGSDFRFKTRIGFDVNSAGQATNLILHSDGDPTMGTAMPEAVKPTRMMDIINALKSKGVREIQGAITLISQDPRVDDAVYAQGISELDARECYGAMASTFNFKSNCSEVRVNAKSGFRWDGAGAGDTLTNSLETLIGDRTSLSLLAMFSPERILQGFALRGTYIAKTPKTLQLKLPVANAVGWYSGELLKTLRANQIAVQKSVIKSAKTAAERSAAMAELARFGSNVLIIESPPLAAIAEEMNKHSDNFLADALFKAIGARLATGEPNLSFASQRKIRESLDHWLTADGHRNWKDEFQFYDGAGLSADSRATPRAFLAVLRQLSKEPTFPALWNSLSVAGVDGTLGDRMKQTSAAGKVRGKTGTLTGSYQLVGFIPKVSGSATEYIPFVILTATTSRNRHVVRKFQDAVVVKLYETINSAH